jgi:hypothetical protein
MEKREKRGKAERSEEWEKKTGTMMKMRGQEGKEVFARRLWADTKSWLPVRPACFAPNNFHLKIKLGPLEAIIPLQL